MKSKIEEIYQRKDMEDKREKIRLEEQSLGPTFKSYEFQKQNPEKTGSQLPSTETRMIAKLKTPAQHYGSKDSQQFASLCTLKTLER